ncbi:MAG: WD40 repeat domain-containing protein, partial [Gemmataceae bacterium]
SLTTGRPAEHFRIESLAVSSDGKSVAIGGGREVELWQRTDSGWQKRTAFLVRGDVKSLSFGGRGGTLLVGGGIYKKPEVHLYDITGESPKPITAFTGLRDVALSVTASSSGKLFAATDETGRVVVWSALGKKLHEWTFPGPVHCVSFAPDGRHLALGNGDGTVYILRLAVPANK